MNIRPISIQSTGSSNTASAHRSFDYQRQDDTFQARRIGAERAPGYGSRSHSSNPDYLRARYAGHSGSPRFRIG